MLKHCKVCDKYKAFTDFGKNSGVRNGLKLQSYCRPCMNAKVKLAREAKKDYYLTYARNYEKARRLRDRKISA